MKINNEVKKSNERKYVMKQKLFPTIFIAFALLGCTQSPAVPSEDYHAHADILVILDGQTLDLNREEFMSTPYRHLSEDVHLHDGNPFVVHFHKENVTIGEFFESLGMGFDSHCFNDGEKQYCSNTEKKLFFYVNGRQNSQFENYVPYDLDRLLIFYGESEPQQETIDSVTEQSCIYSEKCSIPPGFVLPPESCFATQPCVLPE